MEKSKKNLGVLGATLAIGITIGSTTTGIMSATKGVITDKVTKLIDVSVWVDQNKDQEIDFYFSDLCNQLKNQGLISGKCDRELFRDQELCIKYLDSNRDGKADKYRAQGTAIIKGAFTPIKNK